MTAITIETALRVRPERLRAFGDATDSAFYLVTNPGREGAFSIEPGGGYTEYRMLLLDDGEDFERLLREDIPARAHVLVISPDRFISSPPPALLGDRKLMVMPCNSTPTPPEAIAHCLEVMERTDPEEQQRAAERFFGLAEGSDELEIVDDDAGVRAVFRHFADDYHWNQQAGMIEPGEQQVVPSGELSVLPAHIVGFDPERRFALDGELALRGPAILHAGLASYTRGDQERVHGELASLAEHPVIARVDGGVITGVRATHPRAEPAATMLEALFRVDGRYRVVWELGFGINTELEIAAGNTAINEVFGGEGGVFHLGLGLTPFTQYAVGVICPGTRILGARGQRLIPAETREPARRRLNIRRDGGGCGCRN